MIYPDTHGDSDADDEHGRTGSGEHRAIGSGQRAEAGGRRPTARRSASRGMVTVAGNPGAIAAALVASLSSHGGIPETLDGLVESLPAVADPASLALYGGGGLAGFVVVRGLLRRVRGRSQRPVRSSVTSTSTGAGGVGKHNVAFTLPSVLPVSAGIRQVTHNEVHALELGAVVGFVSAWLFSIGRTDPAITIVVAFVAGSLGFERYASKAFSTVRLEPWYALLALLAGGGAGYAFFLGGSAL